MSTRKLRPRPGADYSNAGPVAKKRKVEPVRYDCSSCLTRRIATAFPEYNPSSECEHLINTCKTCLKKWVEAQVDSSAFKTGGEDGKAFGVKCPECPSVMKNVNVESAANKKVFQKFEQHERRHIADTTPGWRWCLSSFCTAGQVHEAKEVVPYVKPVVKTKPKRTKMGTVFGSFGKAPIEGEAARLAEAEAKRDAAALEAATDICICHECGAKACVGCDRPWHEGESCEAYQARIKDRLDEEDATLKEIQRSTKQCPNCSKPIQKNGGCPAMMCSKCMATFCWDCLHINGSEGVYCKCRPRA